MHTILVIEDHFDIRENMAEILELANYRVLKAENGKTGVEMALKDLPDLILCDIMMDELDGYGVLHLLGKHPQTNTIPFVFITAKTQRQELRKGMEMGADDYLMKPFDDIELLHTVETRLKKKSLQMDFYSRPLQEITQSSTQTNGLTVLNQIIGERKLRLVRKKQALYYEGDPVTGIYWVHSGQMKTTKMAEDGRELITGIYDAQHFIATHQLFSNKVHTDNAWALEDSEVSFFSMQEIEKLISQYPDLGSKFIQILSDEVVEKEDQLLQMAYSSVRKRIAEIILNIHQQHGINQQYMQLSRFELAQLSGTAPETVSRTLSEFEQEGLIEKNRNTITLIDLVKLRKLKN